MALLALGFWATANAESVGEKMEEELGAYIAMPAKLGGQGQINVRVIDNQMQVYFLDKEGLVIDPVVDKLYVRWENIRNRTEDGYLPMSPSSEGPYLDNARKLYPPYHFRITLIIPQEMEEDNIVLFGNILRQ